MGRWLLGALLALAIATPAVSQPAGPSSDRWSIYRTGHDLLAAGIRRGDALLEIVCADPQTYTLFYSIPEGALHSSLAGEENLTLTQRISPDRYAAVSAAVLRGSGRVIVAHWMQADYVFFRSLGAAQRSIEMALRLTAEGRERNATSFPARGSTAVMAEFVEQCRTDPGPGGGRAPIGQWSFQPAGPNIVYSHENGTIFGLTCPTGRLEMFYSVPQLDLDPEIWRSPSAELILSALGRPPLTASPIVPFPVEESVVYAHPITTDDPFYRLLATGQGAVEPSLSAPSLEGAHRIRNATRLPLTGLQEQLPALIDACTPD